MYGRNVRVMANVTWFVERRLKLKVNTAKSAVGDVSARSFLGFSFTRGKVPRRRVAPKSLERLRKRVRELTRRARSVRFRQLLTELSHCFQGWRVYYGYCETPSALRNMDGWIRRRLRAYLWHQWKHRRRRYRAPRRLDVRHSLAAKLAGSGGAHGGSARRPPCTMPFPMPSSPSSDWCRWHQSRVAHIH